MSDFMQMKEKYNKYKISNIKFKYSKNIWKACTFYLGVKSNKKRTENPVYG